MSAWNQFQGNALPYTVTDALLALGLTEGEMRACLLFLGCSYDIKWLGGGVTAWVRSVRERLD